MKSHLHKFEITNYSTYVIVSISVCSSYSFTFTHTFHFSLFLICIHFVMLFMSYLTFEIHELLFFKATIRGLIYLLYSPLHNILAYSNLEFIRAKYIEQKFYVEQK